MKEIAENGAFVKQLEQETDAFIRSIDVTSTDSDMDEDVSDYTLKEAVLQNHQLMSFRLMLRRFHEMNAFVNSFLTEVEASYTWTVPQSVRKLMCDVYHSMYNQCVWQSEISKIEYEALDIIDDFLI